MPDFVEAAALSASAWNEPVVAIAGKTVPFASRGISMRLTMLVFRRSFTRSGKLDGKIVTCRAPLEYDVTTGVT